MKKYLVIGGVVKSKIDGRVHYVGPHTLMSLYGLRRRECYLTTEGESMHGLPDGLTELRPRYDGDYRFPLPSDTPTVIDA